MAVLWKMILGIAVCFTQISIALPNPQQADAQSLDAPLDPDLRPPIRLIPQRAAPESAGSGYVMYMFFNAMNGLWQVPTDLVIKSKRIIPAPLGPGFGNQVDIVPTIPTGRLTVSNSLWALVYAVRTLAGQRQGSKLWHLPSFSIVLEGPGARSSQYIGQIHPYVSMASHEADQSQAIDPVPVDTNANDSSPVTEVTEPVEDVSLPANTITFTATTAFNDQVEIDDRAVFRLLNYVVGSFILTHHHNQPLNGPGGGQTFLPGVPWISPAVDTGEVLSIFIASQQDVEPGTYLYSDLLFGLNSMLYEMHHTYGSGKWYQYEGEVRKRAGEKPFAKFSYTKPRATGRNGQAAGSSNAAPGVATSSAHGPLPSGVASA